jgi:hypothetical protein
MAKKSKCKSKHVAKEDCLNMRLWAEGVWEEVLRPHIEPYMDALERGWCEERDYLQTVCQEFHAQFSWRLKDHEEPESVPDYNSRVVLPEEGLDDVSHHFVIALEWHIRSGNSIAK